MSTIKKFQAMFYGNQKRYNVYLHPDLSAAINAIAEQQNLSFSQVINELLAQAVYDYQLTNSSLETWQRLTKREQEVAALIWSGLTNPQIARHLDISVNTVKTHVKKILNKFNVKSKKSLVDLLVGLDLSGWVDLGTDNVRAPTRAASPDGVHP